MLKRLLLLTNCECKKNMVSGNLCSVNGPPFTASVHSLPALPSGKLSDCTTARLPDCTTCLTAGRLQDFTTCQLPSFPQNPFNGIVTVGIKSRNPASIRISIKGSTHLNHFSYGIRATPKTPIRTAEAGVIILVNPSPNW